MATLTVGDFQNLIPELDKNSKNVLEFIELVDTIITSAKEDTLKKLLFQILRMKVFNFIERELKEEGPKDWESLKIILKKKNDKTKKDPGVIRREMTKTIQRQNDTLMYFLGKIKRLYLDLNEVSVHENEDIQKYLQSENEKLACEVIRDGVRSKFLKSFLIGIQTQKIEILIEQCKSYSDRMGEDQKHDNKIDNIHKSKYNNWSNQSKNQSNYNNQKQLITKTEKLNFEPEIKKEIVTCAYCKKKKPPHK